MTVAGQRAAVQAWWAGLTQQQRRDVLRLDAGDVLPDELALDLQMAGVTVVREHGQPVPPDALLDHLTEHRASS
ncbi:hypothetical protein [Kineococcus terrestris]|uniref:hypothetical protein n=1 Tax=Kineococcus terrestris TaxID=2044856 RepID=UPI0034DABE2C